jgi:competence protein ComEA
LKNSFIAFLSYGKSERIAIIIIILLIISTVILPSVYKRYDKPLPVNDKIFDKEIAEFLKNEESAAIIEQAGFDFSNPERSVVKQIITPFQFDPNTLNVEGWKRLGFSEKQATGILKFREKGGYFRKKEDLKKLYAVTDEVYIALEPFVTISQNNKPSYNKTSGGQNPSNDSKFFSERYKAELNSADSAELVKVYGIGPVTARRIIRYRERLGGFTFIEQLREVSGIDSAKFEIIRDGVFADPDVVRKIDINKSTISQLRQHPYIDYYIAKAIVDTRVKKGAFTSPDELGEIPLIYSALYKKLRPYISINQ